MTHKDRFDNLEATNEFTDPGGTTHTGSIGGGSGGGYTVTNVTEEGAVGDGSTDDTTAIQSAIDNTPDGIVYFPPGTYNVSAALNFGQSGQAVHLRGSGQATLSATASITGAGILTTPSINRWNYSVRDLYLDCNSNAEYGLWMGGTSDSSDNVIMRLLAEKVRVNDAVQDGFYIERPILSEFRNCQASAPGRDGFHITGQSTSTFYSSCYTSSAGRHGYFIKNATYSGMRSCASDGATTHGYHLAGADGSSTKNFVLTNCGCETNGEESYFFDRYQGVTLDGCHVWSASDDFPTMSFNACRHITLSSCAVTDNPTNAGNVYLSETDSTGNVTSWPSNFTIQGSYFQGALTGSASVAPEDYVRLLGTTFSNLSYTDRFANDVRLGENGAGIIVDSPDGSATYRIHVDNSGNVTATLL